MVTHRSPVTETAVPIRLRYQPFVVLPLLLSPREQVRAGVLVSLKAHVREDGGARGAARLARGHLECGGQRHEFAGGQEGLQEIVLSDVARALVEVAALALLSARE